MSNELGRIIAAMSGEQIAEDVTFLVETINKLETEVVSLRLENQRLVNLLVRVKEVLGE